MYYEDGRERMSCARWQREVGIVAASKQFVRIISHAHASTLRAFACAKHTKVYALEGT